MYKKFKTNNLTTLNVLETKLTKRTIKTYFSYVQNEDCFDAAIFVATLSDLFGRNKLSREKEHLLGQIRLHPRKH